MNNNTLLRKEISIARVAGIIIGKYIRYRLCYLIATRTSVIHVCDKERGESSKRYTTCGIIMDDVINFIFSISAYMGMI
jgi:hypothetical protein